MFFSIILFIMVFIAIFSYKESSRSIKSDVDRYSTQILKEANLNLERFFREYEQFFMSFASSGDYKHWLETESPSERINSFISLKDNYVRSFATLHPEVLSVAVLNINGNENFFTRDSAPALRYDYSMKNETWMPRIVANKELNMIVSPSTNYVDYNKASVDRPLLTIVKKYEFTPSLQGYVKMDIALQPIQDILSELKINDNGIGMIVDEEGNSIIQTAPSNIGSTLSAAVKNRLSGSSAGSFYLKESKQMVTYRSIDKTDWKIVAEVPYQDVARSVYRIKNVTILVTLVGLSVSMILVVLVSESSTRKLKQLREAMFKTGLNNLEVRVNIKGRDEVADVGRVYNKMLSNLETSIAELNKSRTTQQEAVLAALQSQINSHFLYNALESIKFMAYVANQDEIVRTTLALSDLLRYVSNYQNTVVPLEHEIQYVKNYMQIMQTQYGDELSYEITGANGMEDVLSLKAIIQPIVENSIKYGLEQTGKPLFIRVDLRRLTDDYIVVTITDTGPGFSEVTLQRITDKLQKNRMTDQYKHLSSIGLLNVHYRLKVYYDDDNAGIHIRNVDHAGGTEVTMTFPIRLQEGGGDPESNPDCG